MRHSNRARPTRDHASRNFVHGTGAQQWPKGMHCQAAGRDVVVVYGAGMAVGHADPACTLGGMSQQTPVIPAFNGARYVTPLREGGSLPAIVETDDGSFVVKFRGAGQGAKALVAECLAAALALEVDLPVPQPAIVTLDEGFGAGEPDPEIQDILRGSVGPNFGLAYLPGALAFDPAVETEIAPDLAASIVWLDAFISNVDRTVRNTNILLWHRQLWLIDHGAALYVHHTWTDPEGRSRSPFAQVAQHILLPFAGPIPAADVRAKALLTPDLITTIVDLIPDVWIDTTPAVDRPIGTRQDYIDFLTRRLDASSAFVEEAERARTSRV
jgi:hypothetical protein